MFDVLRVNYREITMHRRPSQELTLQEEGQVHNSSEESCSGQICGSTTGLYGDVYSRFHSDLAEKVLISH